MGYTLFAELKDKDGDDYEVHFRDGYVSLNVINNDMIALDAAQLNILLETLVAAAGAANIELINIRS